MPHYADGTPANVGDFVKGKPYNTDHEIVGTLVQITEGTASCNCIVAFVEPSLVPAGIGEYLWVFNKLGLPVPAHIRRPKGGVIRNVPQVQPLEETLFLVPKTDYGEVRAFTKIA